MVFQTFHSMVVPTILENYSGILPHHNFGWVPSGLLNCTPESHMCQVSREWSYAQEH